MADTKGKYAVDIEDGAEQEEGIPQWAIFAGIGGLLLVIIIIIIVVVAEAESIIIIPEGESAEEQKKTNLELAKGDGAEMTGLGNNIPAVSVLKHVPEDFFTAAGTKTVQPFTSVTTNKVTLTGANTKEHFIKTAEKDLKKKFQDLMRIDANMVNAKVELKAARRLTENGRELSGSKFEQTSAVSAVLPVTPNSPFKDATKLNDAVRNTMAKAALETKKATGSIITAFVMRDIVKSAPVTAPLSELKTTVVAFVAASANVLKTVVETISKDPTSLDFTAVVALIADAVKDVAGVTVDKAQVKPKFTAPKETNGTSSSNGTSSNGRTSSNGNETSSRSRKVRRSLNEGNSDYYAKLIDRLVV